MIKFYIISILLILTSKVYACDSYNDKNPLSAWLGDRSKFSEVYKNGKCALDLALTNVPLEQRKIIANLIAKSYIQAKQNDEGENLTYNY